MKNKTQKTSLLFLSVFLSQLALALTTLSINPGQSIDIQAGDNLRVQCSGSSADADPNYVSICRCYNSNELWLGKVKLSDGDTKWVKLMTYDNNADCTAASTTVKVCK